jgi:electron transport complex protein RnfB
MRTMSHREAPGLVERIDAALPQTQCRRCGYEGCRPYAEAIAAGTALNRCPPGGDPVIAALSSITGRPRAVLDPACGTTEPLAIARIDEASCIGCTLCIDACPVDAIIGAAKRMHAVLPALCSGCALCIPPCPVDCIRMLPAGRAWCPEDARAARSRYDARQYRLATRPRSRVDVAAAVQRPTADHDRVQRQQAVAAALDRARARRASGRA